MTINTMVILKILLFINFIKTKDSRTENQKSIDSFKQKIEEENSEIIGKALYLSDLEKKKNNIELKIIKLISEQKKTQEIIDDTNEKVHQILNSEDFHNIENFYKQLNESTNFNDKINITAVLNIEKKEKEFNELLNEQKILLNDKILLTSTIEELDLLKNEKLHEVVIDISKRFGKIFSDLLPRSCAKLEYQKKDSLLDGIKFKVAIDEIWKDSLTELSGGQKSLVALSFILSLLSYKPAPFYILDEVDAALDNIHTQNIGSMIKNNFKSSQVLALILN